MLGEQMGASRRRVVGPLGTRLWVLALTAIAVLGMFGSHVPPSAAEGQPGEIPEWLRPGAPLRLRIVGPGESRSVTGRYVRHDDSTLCVRTGPSELGDLVEVNPDRVVRLEVSQERGSHAWKGFALGWMVGGAAAMAALQASDEFDRDEKAATLVLGVAFYGPLSGLLGSVVGGSIPKNRWVLIWDRTGEGR